MMTGETRRRRGRQRHCICHTAKPQESNRLEGQDSEVVIMLLRPEEAKSDTQLVFAWDERIPKGVIDDFMATIDTPELKCVADKRRQRGAYARG